MLEIDPQKLDEISEMDPRLQAKLLRAIQERVIDRVGGTTPVKVNIRLIATTNRNMEEEVKKGNFREDLYFRLNVVNVRVPALRERPNDIEPLALHFIDKYSQVNDVPARKLSEAARQKIVGHTWRGNVRELENVIERAVLLCQGDEIKPDHLAIDTRLRGPTEDTLSAGMTIAEMEKSLILRTLEKTNQNRTQAAKILGISIRTLRNKLNEYKEDGGSREESV
jgi:DNA-binding NtrC family response regulator